MKKLLGWIIILAIAYFIIGFVMVRLSWFSKDVYLTFSAIIGGLASVSGLFVFTSWKIERDDIEKVGIEYFKKVVESAEILKTNEQTLSEKKKEIDELEIKKQEMEYLVRKASMSLFLKDQLERAESRIMEITQENRELEKLLQQRITISKQLMELEIEVSSDNNVEMINEIIDSVKNRMSDRPIRKKPEKFFEYLMYFLREVSEIMSIGFSSK